MSFRQQLSVVVFLSLAWLSSPAQTSSKADRVYLGFLDDAREEMVNWKPGVAEHRLVRPAFEKTASGWRLIDESSFPAHMRWTIAFDGKNVGLVDTQAQVEVDQAEQHFLTAVQMIFPPNATLPNIGTPSKSFAGLMAMGPTKMRRPLVAVSESYFHDPDRWKRVNSLRPEVAAAVRAAFRRDFPHTERCVNEEVVERDWKFPDEALRLPTAYGSDKGSSLVQTQLDAGICGYVDDPDDPLANPWFLVARDGSVRRIGSFMSLLDAGDYDNDGRSEVIFFISKPEDTDGFLLFDADFNKQVSLTWSYH